MAIAYAKIPTVKYTVNNMSLDDERELAPSD
jgi:hypothetical protein